MPELPDRIDGEIIEAAHMNDATIRTVQRYASVTERDALNPAPENGQPAWIIDINQLQIWDGTDWKQINADGLYLPLHGGTMDGRVINQSTGSLAFTAERGGVQWAFGMYDGGNGRISEDDETRLLFLRGGGISTAFALLDSYPAGVLKYASNRTLTATVAGTEELTDTIPLPAGAIGNPDKCVVTLMGTQNVNRAKRRTWAYTGFTTDEITVATTALESSTGTGTFTYRISIVEYLDDTSTATLPEVP